MDKYIIRVTAGPDYNIDKHVVVPVNRPEPIKISNPLMDSEVNVRLENYRGLPRGSPTTSPYFSTEPHASNKDKYSMAIRFTPRKPATSSPPSSPPGPNRQGESTVDEEKKEEADAEENDDEGEDDGALGEGISGLDLQFGNDFDHPIRDRLPPGFSYAMNIVKWWIDPGLEGDAYADRPYLYGPALSSFNALHAGAGAGAAGKPQHDDENDDGNGIGIWCEEGGDARGTKVRERLGAPPAAKDRMKWALRKENKERWVFEYGSTYVADFYNPYLDFSDFSLRLPGFTLPIMKYWDGQPLRSESNGGGGALPKTKKQKRSHTLRYVLRNRTTGDTYLVILFTLHLREDVNEDGSLKPEALEGLRQNGGKTEVVGEAGSGKVEESDSKDSKDYEQAREKFEGLDIGKGDDDDGGVD
ncbi:hypothetical protein SLS62_004963 [Diatrype stigma]|uniref:Domain of unknown function at the cortex 1 domain-containing protein n=1 Tax=Diatrype stigma TaxID=117547 RepID=A0AAN9V1Y0_9PEZI